MDTNWFILEDVGNFNGKIFSFLVNVEDIKIEYDILEMSYKLSCNLYFFVDYWRRREEERISLMYSKSFADISSDDIYNIPLFKKLLECMPNDDEVKKEKLIDYLDNNKEIKKALMLRYALNIGSKVYTDDSIKVCPVIDRWCGVEEVPNKRILNYENYPNKDNEEFYKGLEKCIVIS